MSLEENLRNWIIQETSWFSEGRIKNIPNITTLSKLTEGKNSKIWKYVITHVKVKDTVKSVKKLSTYEQANDFFTDNDIQNKYPPILKNNTESLRNEILKIEEIVEFEENTLESIRNQVLTLKAQIQDIKKDNCISTQKQVFMELTSLSYKEKQILLNELFEKLMLLLNKAFTIEKSEYFLNLDHSHYFDANKTKFNIDSVVDMVKNIIFQIVSVLKNKTSIEKEKIVSNSCIDSMNEIMSYTSMISFVNSLKQLSKQSESCLKVKDFLLFSSIVSTENKEVRNSDKFLQEMKLAQVDSYFKRMKVTNNASSLETIENLLLVENLPIKSEEGNQFLKAKVTNEGLKQSITYLENILSEELKKTKLLVGENNVNKSLCDNLNNDMCKFYQNLKSIHYLLSTVRPTFTDITKSLISSTELMHGFILTTIEESYFLDIKSNIQNDYEMSYNILKEDHILKSPLHSSCFENKLIPYKALKPFCLENFHEQHVIIERIADIKRVSIRNVDNFKFEDKNELFRKYFEFLNLIKIKMEDLKLIEKKYISETKKDCKILKDSLEDWWEQKAQFIHPITYEGKSLKMWLDILYILDI